MLLARFAIIVALFIASSSVYGASSISTKNLFDDNKLRDQWKALSYEAEPGNNLFRTALLRENNAKNRYGDVLAVERTRVKLKNIKGSSDYINANLVDGFHEHAKSAYIAAQAPLPETFNDFWSMIWDQNVDTIVMLTRLEESYVVKADQYWPGKKGVNKIYGDIMVTLIDSQTKHNGDYTINTFNVQRGDENRIVKQYYFAAWPDHGVPSDPHPLLDMMNDIELERSSKQKSPILVHCSAGLGRTGTFIIVHAVLSKMKREQNFDLSSLNLQPLLSKLREQRSGSIPRFVQYKFCYQLIATAVENKYAWLRIDVPKDSHVDEHLEAAKEVKVIDANQDIVIL